MAVSVCAHKGTVPTTHQWLKVEGDVIVSSLKTAENGKDMVVRFYSLSDSDQEVTIKLYGEPKAAARVNTLEKEIEKLEVKDNKVTLTAKAFTTNAVKIEF